MNFYVLWNCEEEMEMRNTLLENILKAVDQNLAEADHHMNLCFKDYGILRNSVEKEPIDDVRKDVKACISRLQYMLSSLDDISEFKRNIGK